MSASKLIIAATVMAWLSTSANAAPSSFATGFYFTSYGQNDFADKANAKRLEEYRAEIPTATHAVAAVHVRVPGGPASNNVVRDKISEDPEHLVPWWRLAAKQGLRAGLIIILFSDDSWGWGGDWKPSNPGEALASYHTAVQPYLKAAEDAKVDFVILCDEWSNLFIRKDAVDAFRNLYKSARRDYSAGWLSLNINKLEEGAILPEITALTDVVGITAYVPLATEQSPSYEEMLSNLTVASGVAEVREEVAHRADLHDHPAVKSYMHMLRMFAGIWGKPLLLTTGYKSTRGAAINPADQPENGVDQSIQAKAWKAFIDAARNPQDGPGSALYGILAWRAWPAAADDDGSTGFSVIGKPAAEVISEAWAKKDAARPLPLPQPVAPREPPEPEISDNDLDQLLRKCEGLEPKEMIRCVWRIAEEL